MTSNMIGTKESILDHDSTMVQMLTPEGQRVDGGSYERYVADLTDADLRGLYRDMALIRRVDAEGNALQRQGQLGLWAPLLGQEAAQIGLGHAMRNQDFVFPTYREHGLAWCRGLRPETIFEMYRGQNHAGWDPQAYNFHTYTIVIGAQMLQATGYAMGISLDGDVGTGDPDRDAVAIACCGDGATSQGEVSEALNFASTFHAPTLFFIQNNQWAISEPNSVEMNAPLFTRGTGFGVPGTRVDGNDILAMYAVAKANLDDIRAGNGPRLLEAFTYRMGAHTTAVAPTMYRSDALTESRAAKDPIGRFKTYLETEVAHRSPAAAAELADFFASVEREADALAAHIREAVMAMPKPPVSDIFDYVFEEPHPLIEEEKREYMAYLDGFAEDLEADAR